MPEAAQVQADSEQRHIIWSDYNLDYEKDWKADLEADFPDLTEDERIEIMYEHNALYLDDERRNLDIQFSNPIIVIADLGLWDGRHQGYKIIESGNVKDCLRISSRDIDMLEWYVDGKGEFRCDAYHHDGTNHYLYRAVKENTTDEQLESLLAPYKLNLNNSVYVV